MFQKYLTVQKKIICKYEKGKGSKSRLEILPKALKVDENSGESFPNRGKHQDLDLPFVCAVVFQGAVFSALNHKHPTPKS